MIFTLNKDEDLSILVIEKMLNYFRTNDKPRLEKYKNYYDGKQKILNKSYKDSTKPNNKIVTNYCLDITDSYNGYLAAPSFITYKSDKDISEITDILKANNYQTEDSEFLHNALIYGIAYELMFVDSKAKIHFKQIEPTNCFAVYDDTLESELIYFFRWYAVNQWNGKEGYKLDIYSKDSIKHYSLNELLSTVKFISEEPNFFNGVPVNILEMPDGKSIFDCILPLQDAHNELLSSEIDDFSAFCDAYLTLVGVDADAEDIAMMKENRVLVLPEGATANWLTKNSNDTQVENMLKRIHDSIYRIAHCPDFSSESFVGGVSSGIAISYRLTGMENRAANIESKMRESLKNRLSLIAGIASLKLGEEYTDSIDIVFTRNIPTDTAVVIDNVMKLKGTVSESTLLAQLPFVDDVAKEKELIKGEQEEEVSLYSFGGVAHEPNTEGKEPTIE